MECDTLEKRNSELEDIAIKMIQKEAQKITNKKMRQALTERKTMFSD